MRVGNGSGGHRILCGASEQVPIPSFFLSRSPVQPGRKGVLAGLQAGQDLLDVLNGSEVVIALGSEPKLTGGLVAPEHQDGEDSGLLAVDLENVVEGVLVLGGSASGGADRSDETFLPQGLDAVEDVRLRVGRHRIAVGLLVGGSRERVDRHRVVVGCRHLLLDETPEQPKGEGVEVHGETIPLSLGVEGLGGFPRFAGEEPRSSGAAPPYHSLTVNSASPFLLDVGDLLAHPGETRTVGFDAPLTAEIEHARVTGPIAVEGRLEGLTDGVYMVAMVQAPAHITCNRCLTEWDEVLELQVKQLFTREPDEDGYRIDEHWINAEGPVHDEVVLALPLAPLCREECKGICATCGADLNTAPCQGHEENEPSPFAVLKDLLPD